jgi:hypothetical protein
VQKRLILELWRLTLEHEAVEDHRGGVRANPTAMETHLGGVETYLGVVDKSWGGGGVIPES